MTAWWINWSFWQNSCNIFKNTMRHSFGLKYLWSSCCNFKKSSGKSAVLTPKRFETVAAGCGSGYPTRSTFGCCRFVLLQFWQIFVSQFRQIDLAIRVSIVDKYISETSSEGPGGRARSTFCRRRRSTFYSMLPRCSRDVSVKTTFVIILGDLWCLGEVQKGDQQCISSLNCHVFVACY